MPTPQAETFFEAAFEYLLSFKPLRWQRRLFKRFIENHLPDACNLPTGLGKTSVIPIWLIALAYQAESGEVLLPRRMFYVVNRRTVVDQATNICLQIRKQLGSDTDSETAQRLKKALASLAAVPGLPAIGISTLRGELADNEEWKLDPCRPAIVVGTVDMIGSKLLFSGYGDSYKVRAFHAGLVGHDALIVHDEAHLVPAFSKLLRTVARYQPQDRGFKPFKVLELSATFATEEQLDVFKLEDEDFAEEFVKRRWEAKKCCVLEPVKNGQKLEEAISELALRYKDKPTKVLIYTHSPDSVKAIADQLAKRIEDKSRVIALTGTLRGYERDRLAESDLYRAFLESKPVSKSHYFVANAAGEVGLDLDADHLICDLQPAERFIQRLGRVNRRGNGAAEVKVVYVPQQGSDKQPTGEEQGEKQLDLPLDANRATEESSKREEQSEEQLDSVAHVLRALQQMSQNGCADKGIDVSPRALTSAPFPEKAFSPLPGLRLFDSAALDRWSATSMAQVEDISDYLHGLERELPETFVAWRAEVNALVKAAAHLSRPDEVAEMLREWFDLAPIRSPEHLRETPSNVLKALKQIASRQQSEHQPFVLIRANGEVELRALAEVDKLDRRQLHYATVVLPPSAGGLDEQGLLDPKSSKSVCDVAEEGATWTRFIVTWSDEEQQWQVGRWNNESAEWAFEPLPDQTDHPSWSVDDAVARAIKVLAAKLKKGLRLVLSLPLRYAPASPLQAEDEVCREALLLAVTDFGRSQRVETLAYDKPPTVDEHCALAEQWAEVIARKLGLPNEVANALRLAARYHDLGKARRRWQRAVFNTSFPQQPAWAKSGQKGMDAARLRGYRHELGSLIEAQDAHRVCDDLALHLIAAHHGWARPLFRESAFDDKYDEETNRKAVFEAALRFERLQRRYSWWALAWLEGLIHIVDILASNECRPAQES